MSIRVAREGPVPNAPQFATPPAQEKKPSHDAASREEGPSPFARILRGIGNEMNRGETLVHGAMHSGRDLGAQELLALQAGVYRYSEAVDLAAKLVDRAATGVKTIIQGQ